MTNLPESTGDTLTTITAGTAAPWSALSPREKDARVAEAIGIDVVWDEFLGPCDRSKQTASANDPPLSKYHKPSDWYEPILSYTTDHNAAQQALSEVERRGREDEYVRALDEIMSLGVWGAEYTRGTIELRDVWLLICASPDKLCEAAVMALEGAQ